MAGTQPTTAETTAMTQAAVHVDNAGQAITTIKNQIHDAVNATYSGYVTEGGTLFRDIMAQWDVDFGKIIDALETIRENLVGTTKVYTGAMDIDSMSANQIAALLNGNDV